MGTGQAGGVVERHVRLEPVPESARFARRAVIEALEAAGHPELADSAALMVSELVTNAILHARTTIEVDVAVSPTGVRVGVNDRNPHLPAPRDYGRSATTGRGLEVVGLLAAEHGTETHDDGSKTVWFALGTPVAATAHHEGAEMPAAPRGALVRLEQTPWRLARAWQQHADALLRESLLACWETGGDVDARLAELNAAGEAFAELAAALDGCADVVEQSALRTERDRARIDLSLRLSAATVTSFVALGEALDQAAVLSEQGLLLAPPTQPEIRLLRRWICDEVARQAAGAAPNPWEGVPADAVAPPARVLDWDTDRVARSPDALVAADDANRIVAVSPSALALLGWSAEDLVGRRVVSMIPSRLREAHVAAFTEHLLTGATTILDGHVSVPALKADGSEVRIDLHVTREAAGGGRSVFVAALRRLDAPGDPRRAPEPTY